VVLATLLLSATAGHTQDMTESSLKAAFTYSFAKFTAWPADVLPATATFAACVLGSSAVRDALAQTVKGRLLDGHSISVSQVAADGELRSCHLLYVSGVTPAELMTIVAGLQDAPVLTISDADNFAQRGGMAQMFVENGKMRFDLNLGVARRAHLQLSSRLLALAAHVHDGTKGDDR
jgi:hypothetical protein